MNNNNLKKLTKEEINLIIKECRKQKENNKSRKLKPLTEKEKEIIWRSLSWE